MRQLGTPSIDTTPYILAAPVGVDTVVKDLQAHLSSSLSWLEKSFNRATTMSNFDEVLKTFPVCWVDDGLDKINMIGLGNYKAYSFFHAEDNETPIGWTAGIANQFETDLDLYFWFNLELVDPAKTYDYLEELNEEIKIAISSASYSGNSSDVELLDIIKDPLDIYADWTEDVTVTQSLYYPFHALKYELRAVYETVLPCV